MTVAAAPMFDTVSREAGPPRARGVGLLAIALGIASFALLAAHPGGDAKTFADVLKDEASNQIPNAVVHGGFIVVLALQTVCYAVFSARLGLTRAASVAGLVLFGFGAAFLCASLLVDGLVIPAVAARYLPKPDKIDNARVLFVLMGTLVSFLLPIGLAFQSAAIAAWGWALTASGRRAAGVFGIVAGGIIMAAVVASFVLGNPMTLMAALAVTAVWGIVAGTVLLRQGA
jgi:hypothetical protein